MVYTHRDCPYAYYIKDKNWNTNVATCHTRVEKVGILEPMVNAK